MRRECVFMDGVAPCGDCDGARVILWTGWADAASVLLIPRRGADRFIGLSPAGLPPRRWASPPTTPAEQSGWRRTPARDRPPTGRPRSRPGTTPRHAAPACGSNPSPIISMNGKNGKEAVFSFDLRGGFAY